MKICGFSKLTLLDYPGHIAATVFVGGCNFRCPFCQNGGLVLRPDSIPAISEERVIETLNRRKGKLEGVCITGGEPTLQAELPEFIAKIKSLGLMVKLDTNGTSPDMLSDLINEGLIDYIAMDIKSGKKGYPKTVGRPDPDMRAIEQSVELLMRGIIPYEFRTTVVSELHNEGTFHEIGQWIKGAEAYYLQQFRDSGECIARGMTAPSSEQMERFRSIAAEYVPKTRIRGMD